MIALDHFDIAILTILQTDNMTPQRDIGEQIGLSAPAVQRRIKRLRETGVIRGDIAVLDPDKIGGPITIVAEVKMEVEKVEIVKQAKEIFRNTPQVQQCYYVTGDVDFILIIVVYSMKEYEELTQRLFFGNNNVKNFKTSIALDIVKAGLNIPLNKS